MIYAPFGHVNIHPIMLLKSLYQIVPGKPIFGQHTRHQMKVITHQQKVQNLLEKQLAVAPDNGQQLISAIKSMKRSKVSVIPDLA